MLLFLITGTICFYVIEKSTRYQITYDLESVKPCKVGLVLGTSPQLKGGYPNLYFTYRIDAAIKLYNAQKIKYLLLSGDNRRDDYNEPKEMHDALVKRGVPDSCLVLDYAGLRTFDSMVRCKDIFGQDSVIVISQQFHNARAVYIANKIGLAACGFNAQEVTTQKAFKIKIREFFSRIKCVMDIYVLNTKPKYLGQKVNLIK
ncbi:MAG: ElyC/SanA/YdcF family protein [Bacteroidota bacterium]|nr:ElyC/SanA/YdcF family protein [Bacteroidota bacterium]